MHTKFQEVLTDISPITFCFSGKNFIPLEAKSQGNTPVTPSDTTVQMVKGKRHSEVLITTKRWAPIATKRSRKPQTSASIQGKTTLTTCTQKITVIDPVVTSKGKFPKEVENRFVQGTVKARGQPRRPGRGHLGHSGGWQETEGNHTHSATHLPIQQKPQTRGLEGYVSSSSAPPTPQRSFPMAHGQQEVQPSIPLGRTWSKLPEDNIQRDILQRSYGNPQSMESHQAVQTPGAEGNQDKGESSHYPSYIRTAEPGKAYSNSFRRIRSRQTQLSSGFKPFWHQKISGQE
ncbi:hypothetical protein O181_024970 [Austropuccinia psidii MF-1]|uniref:Uncharacterized protein n=1 Tax=Austropuccinia psidii MF-1 TaxID=1389203 RepID=A0A9Q3CLJ2_9BASI|nr:hypothetical protein [Austropuccinia psidii MF-1]